MMKNNLIHIGSTEQIAFPDYDGLQDVRAKIDTGADYSAIWASNIIEQDGVLEFELFGPGSLYYNGQKITTNDYSVTSVKNSFGHSELRYKVKLSIRIGKKKIKVEFRLADRSRNRYPVLIGKSTLKKRFIVDVAKGKMSLKPTQKLRVLILNSCKSTTHKNFFDKISQDNTNLRCDFMTYDDLYCTIDNKKGIQVHYIDTRKTIDSYDMIYFKTYFKRSEMAVVIAEYALSNGINFADTEIQYSHAYTKLVQYAKLAKAGVPIPDTIAVHSTQLKDLFDVFESNLGLPFILKDAAAERGDSNYLIYSKKHFDEVITQIKNESYYIAQSYIENNGDYRVIVLDKKVKLIIERKSIDTSTHLSNISKGGEGKIVAVSDFPVATQAIAVRAAITMNREVAGVDLIHNKRTDLWYVLEVNNSPQLATGSFTQEKEKAMINFLKNYARK